MNIRKVILLLLKLICSELILFFTWQEDLCAKFNMYVCSNKFPEKKDCLSIVLKNGKVYK